MTKKNNFKKGDIVIPMPGRRKSNDFDINIIKKAKVLKVWKDNWSTKTSLRLKILETNKSHHWKDNEVLVFTYAFESIDQQDNYEVY